MIRMFKWSALAVVLALVFAVAYPVSAQDQQHFRQIMGENFQHLSVILGKLITSNYSDLPEEIGTIEQHADYLLSHPPADIKDTEQLDLFKTYAQTLKIRATNMISVAKEVVRRDKESAKKGELPVDYLRAVLAEHYGQIVTTCVLCHNQFRRHIVR